MPTPPPPFVPAPASPSRPAGGLGTLVLAVGLALSCLAGWPGQAQAGTIFTPSISVGMGYDDNVRLQRNPRADSFVQVRPAVSLETGRPSNKLILQAKAAMEYYRRLDQFNGFRSGDVSARWNYAPSQRWNFEVANTFSSSYDQAEFFDTGELARVRDDTGRRDRNTTSLRSAYAWGPHSHLDLGYSYSIISNESESQENAVYHTATLGLVQRLATDYRGEVSLSGSHDDYERTVDVERATVDARLVRMFGPTSEGFVGATGSTTRAITDDPARRRARDYDTYGGQVGYKHSFSPRLTAEAVAGWTIVEGESSSNSASGKGYPTGRVSLTYRQQRWRAMAYARASLEESQAQGDNTGLVDRRSAGVMLDMDLAQHWSMQLNADYINDDYKQNPQSAGTVGRGDVDAVRLGGVLNYHLARHWRLSLDYRYLNRDSEDDTDDRSQNRVLFLVTTEYPWRW